MEVGPNSRRPGRAVQPWGAAAIDAAAEQEAEEEDESLGDRADQAWHGTTVSVGAWRYVSLMVVVFVLFVVLVGVVFMPAGAFHGAQHFHPARA